MSKTDKADKTVIISVRIPEASLKKIEAIAKRRKESRSQIINEALELLPEVTANGWSELNYKGVRRKGPHV